MTLVLFCKTDPHACENLYFDKTKNFHGYNIKAVFANDADVAQTNETKVGCDMYLKASQKIVCKILDHVNVTITLKIHNSIGGFNNDLGEPYGPVKEVLSGAVDAAMTGYYLRYEWKRQAYPFQFNPLKIMSLKQSAAYTPDRFSVIFDIKFWGFLIMSFITSVAILKYILKTSMAIAAFEFMQTLGDMSTLGSPEGSPTKVLLITFMYLIFVITSSIESCFSAVSTAPHKHPTIDSTEDLIRSNLTVYGIPSFREIIAQEEIRERYHSVGNITECTNRLLKGENITCLYLDPWLRFFFSESEYSHISKYSFADRYLTYLFSEDSPLLSKFNGILFRLSDGGFIQLFYSRDELYYMKSSGTNEVKSLDLENLRFTFYFSLWSWALAIVVLFTEIIIHVIQKGNMKFCKLNKFTQRKVNMLRPRYRKNH